MTSHFLQQPTVILNYHMIVTSTTMKRHRELEVIFIA